MGKEIFEVAKTLQMSDDHFEIFIGGPLFQLGFGEEVFAKNGLGNRIGIHF